MFASHSQSGDPYERYLYMIAFHPEKLFRGLWGRWHGLGGQTAQTILVNEQLILAVSNRDDRGRLASFDIKDCAAVNRPCIARMCRVCWVEERNPTFAECHERATQISKTTCIKKARGKYPDIK